MKGETSASSFIGKIPVKNIWLLMAYAAQYSRLPEKTKSDFIDNCDELPDVVITLLCDEVENRMRRGLTTGYVPRSAALHRVRGRIDSLETESKLLLSRGKVACRFNELSSNTPRNQFVSSALRSLSNYTHSSSLAHRARSISRNFDHLGVEHKTPSPAELSKDRLGRHDAHDREMIELAKVALDLSIPTEDLGGTSHYSASKNEFWVRRLYEKAIAGFYRYATKDQAFQLRTGTHLYWPYTDFTSGIPDILPRMEADITIDSTASNTRLVIDTKFNEILIPGRRRDETLRSGYLYQIYTYLRTQECSQDLAAQTASGLLLHPSIGESIFESIALQSHKISFATVDLTQSTQAIKDELLGVLHRAL